MLKDFGAPQLKILQTLRRARNQERILKHGWYVVKNRSSTETKAKVSLNASREKESRLFAGGAWRPSSSGLQDDRMGIHSLRTGLSSVFCAHIRAEFPAFNQQTRTILKKRREELAALGPARSTVAEQRDYLKAIVDLYQDSKGRCLTEDFQSSRKTDEAGLALERRLALRKKTNLRDSLKHGGALWTFQIPNADRDDWSDKAASASFDVGTTTNIYTWINDRYQETKSCTMPGLVPCELIERLFEEQTVKWRSITDSFVESVKKVFISAAAYCLRLACTNDLIYVSLERLIREEIEAKMAQFRSCCHSLIRKERKGMQVIACEEQFIKDIREARTLRLISAIAKLENDSPLGTVNASTFGQSSPAGSSLFANAKSTPGAGFGQSASTITSGNSGGFSSTGLFGSKSNLATTASETTVPSTGLFGSKNSQASTASETTVPLTTPAFGSMGLFGALKFETTTTTFRTLTEFVKNNQAKLTEVLTHERQLVYEIHDILKAYYAISVQHYTDMVCKNELNDTFAEDTMNLFSKEFIDQLSEATISEIAAESPADRKKRRELKEEIERLETAISESEKILKQTVDD